MALVNINIVDKLNGIKRRSGGIAYEIPKSEFQKKYKKNDFYLRDEKELFEEWFRYKFDRNSINDLHLKTTDLSLSRCVMVYPDRCVFIEGCPYNQGGNSNRLLGRTKYNEDLKIFNENGNGGKNKYMLLWEGSMRQYSFGNVEVKTYSMDKLKSA